MKDYKRGDIVWVHFVGEKYRTKCRVRRANNKKGLYVVQEVGMVTEGLGRQHLHDQPFEENK